MLECGGRGKGRKKSRFSLLQVVYFKSERPRGGKGGGLRKEGKDDVVKSFRTGKDWNFLLDFSLFFFFFLLSFCFTLLLSFIIWCKRSECVARSPYKMSFGVEFSEGT